METARKVIVNVDGQSMATEGVTRYTTCDDVIEMVFYNCPVNTDSYALFESSCGIERMLYGKDSVLKAMRSWGADQNSFTLLARKVDNVKSNMATLSQARRKLRKIRSLNANVFSSKVNNRTVLANLNKPCDKALNNKDIDNVTPANETKVGLLKRFLSDVMLQKKKQTNKRSSSRLATRTSGDGCYDECKNERQEPIGIEQEKEPLRRHNSYLNAAFVETDDTVDGDDTDIDNLDLADESYSENDSICELERNICEMSESDTDECDSSDNEGPFCETENTVIKCERIIDLFRKVAVSDDDTETEDDYMESFMNTVIEYADSDEGIGSLDSDAE